MKSTTIRLRSDQTAFIDQVTRERATDLSDFVRLCIDHSAPAVAQKLPLRITLTPGRRPSAPGVASMRSLQAERKRSAKLRGERRAA